MGEGSESIIPLPVPQHGRGGELGQLAYSHALRVGSPVYPTSGSALVCFPSEMHVYGEGWYHISQLWGTSSSIRGMTSFLVPGLEGPLFQGHREMGSALW